MSGFISSPTNVGTAYGYHRIGLKRTNDVVVTIPVVILSLAVLALTIGTIQPYRENRSVLGEQLSQLSNVEIVICLAFAIGIFGSIPRRQVYAELQSMTSGGLTDLTNEIPFSVPPRRGGNGMLRVTRWPQAESIMMLARQDDTSHSTSHQRIHPLFHIYILWIEQRRILMSKTPFSVCHGVHAEVYESIHLHTLPDKLLRRGTHVCEVIQVDTIICWIAHFCSYTGING